ncbi:MAG: hypothetical protein ACLP50_08450 [Solirubrobacteraceae bacterium]
MSKDVQIVTRPVRQITINTGRRWAEFRGDYERAVPSFDRPEAVRVVLGDSDWDAIERLSETTATNGFVNFFTFEPSPVMHLTGSAGNAVTYMTGNIIKAEPGFRKRPGCLIYILLRVVISAGHDREAQLTIDHPADLFAAYGDPALDRVAAGICMDFADLLGQLGAPVPSVLTNL